MKRLLQITLLFIISLDSVQAQSSYNFSYFMSAYTELTNPTQLFPVGFFDTLVPGYNVTLAGRTNDSIRMRLKGTLSADTITTLAERTFEPFGGEHGQGQYGYVIDGAPGNRIIKIQYKNVKFDHDMIGNDRINFQVWLFEYDNSVEVHYGSSIIQNPTWDYYYVETGAYVGSLGCYLTGPAASPIVDTSTGVDLRLTGTPPDGMVYRFEPVTNLVGSYKNGVEHLVVYPNPAGNAIYLSGTANGPLQITTITGQVAMDIPKYDKGTGIDVSNLPAGMYIVKAKGNHYKFNKL
jgi:hypothetical protein